MDKPYLTIDQQVEKLIRDYKLRIDDKDNAKCILFSLSYYDLVNGYKFIFMKNDKEFYPGVSLDYLMQFHIFNKHLQSLIFKYSTLAENSFKNNLSHVIAESISVDHNTYLNFEHYDYIRNSNERKNFREALETMRQITLDSNETPTKHYRLTKNHIPPWILLRNTNFSYASSIFLGLKEEDKNLYFKGIQMFKGKKIDYQVKVSLVVSTLRCTRKFRNQIAHNLNFINYRCFPIDLQINRLFYGSLVKPNEIKKSFNNVWACILSIVFLLNNHDLARLFLYELKGYLDVEPELAKIYCRFSGIPEDYSDRISEF